MNTNLGSRSPGKVLGRYRGRQRGGLCGTCCAFAPLGRDTRAKRRGILLALPPLLGHLRFDLVNFLERDGATIRVGGDTGLEERGTCCRSNGTGVAVAQFAQLIELALADKVVLPLALNHGLEGLLVVTAVVWLINLIQLRPILGRVANKHRHLAQQAGAIFVSGHRGASLIDQNISDMQY